MPEGCKGTFPIKQIKTKIYEQVCQWTNLPYAMSILCRDRSQNNVVSPLCRENENVVQSH